MPKIIADEMVFKAVIQTITERGYAGATTRQMAEAAGVSEVTLFRKYGSKQQLITQAITAIIQQTDFEAAVEYTGDVEADLLRILNAYRGSVVLHGRFFAALFVELSRNSELADSFTQPVDLFRSAGNMLARYQAEGWLRPEPPFHALAALLGPMIYLAMVGSTIQGIDLPPLDLPRHVTLFLEGRKLVTG